MKARKAGGSLFLKETNRVDDPRQCVSWTGGWGAAEGSVGELTTVK